MHSTTTETAVQRCVDAYYKACEQEDPTNEGLDEAARQNVRLAWRHAMPFLIAHDLDAIDAFIACVSHGLVFEVFSEREASKLLYAAQTAIASRRVRLQSERNRSILPANQPQTLGAPSLATAPPSTRVGKLEPIPSSTPAPPTPSPQAPQAQLAPPQVARVSPLDLILDDFHAGKFPREHLLDRLKPAFDALPALSTYTPLPLGGRA